MPVRRQAKLLNDHQVRAVLDHISRMRHPLRNRVMFLLSVKAGLRAAEIAQLTWSMVLDPQLQVQDTLEVRDGISKKERGRVIPMHPMLRDTLVDLRRTTAAGPETTVIVSERGNAMSGQVVVNWFDRLYRTLGYEGCSSHSGRRTMITKAARRASQVGASIVDVAGLAGHADIRSTRVYIEQDSEAKRKLIGLI